MGFCTKHLRYSPSSCSLCAHELAKEEKADLKANEKRVKTLEKAKQKSSEPRKKPKAVSEKRKELNKEYFKLVDQFKNDNPKCMAKLQGCTNDTDDPHHRKGRGRYLLDISTWLAVCRNCHIYIENHPEESRERGWSESRLSVNQERPTI